jgi:hypothetical protein
MIISKIFYLVGLGLLILGGLSGVALFLRAVSTRDKATEEAGRSTLWGLFLIGVVGGVILVVLAGSIQ